MSELQAAAKNMLRALNDYDRGWPHPDSDLGHAAKRLRAALVNEDPALDWPLSERMVGE